MNSIPRRDTAGHPEPTHRRPEWRRLSSGLLLLGLVGGCAHYEPQPVAPEETAAAFASRSLADEALRTFLNANGIAAPLSGEPWTLRQLTLVAFYFEPTLAEARAQLLAAEAARQTAAARPNPSVSFTPAYDSGIPDSASPWILPLAFDVPFETAGKRGYRTDQARARAEAARWDLVGNVWKVRSRVRAALLDLYAATETGSLLEQEERVQDDVVRLLDGQLAAGAVSGFEVTQARLAREATQLARQQAAAQGKLAEVQLAGALGLPASALANCRFSFTVFESLPRTLTAAAVRRDALLNRADVRSALAGYAASQSALQLEIARQYPDIHLGPGYAWNTGSAGDSEWSLGLGLTLPILDQNQGPIAEARARRELAAAHFRTVQAQALGEIEGALSAYSSAVEQIATTRMLRQNLRQRLDRVREQVEAGAAEPVAEANAAVEFAANAQSQLDARIRAQQALGQLEDAVQSQSTLPPDEVKAGETNLSGGAK